MSLSWRLLYYHSTISGPSLASLSLLPKLTISCLRTTSQAGHFVFDWNQDARCISHTIILHICISCHVWQVNNFTSVGVFQKISVFLLYWIMIIHTDSSRSAYSILLQYTCLNLTLKQNTLCLIDSDMLDRFLTLWYYIFTSYDFMQKVSNFIPWVFF